MKTVLKIEKIHSLYNLIARTRHCYKIHEIEGKHFSEKREYLKKPIWTLYGTIGNPYIDIKNLCRSKKIERRKNSVFGLEIVLSMSNEFFHEDDEIEFDREKIKIFVNRSKQYLMQQFKGQVAHICLHLHETTPHIHAFVVPFEETTKRGRYNSAPYHLIKTDFLKIGYLHKIQRDYWRLFGDFKLEPLSKPQTVSTLKGHYLESINRSKILEEKNDELNAKVIDAENRNSLLMLIINKLKDLFKVFAPKPLMDSLIDTIPELKNIKEVEPVNLNVHTPQKPRITNNISQQDDDEFELPLNFGNKQDLEMPNISQNPDLKISNRPKLKPK